MRDELDGNEKCVVCSHACAPELQKYADERLIIMTNVNFSQINIEVGRYITICSFEFPRSLSEAGAIRAAEQCVSVPNNDGAPCMTEPGVVSCRTRNHRASLPAPIYHRLIRCLTPAVAQSKRCLISTCLEWERVARLVGSD